MNHPAQDNHSHHHVSLPVSLIDKLRAAGIETETIQSMAESDLTLEQRFGTTYLLLTPKAILITDTENIISQNYLVKIPPLIQILLIGFMILLAQLTWTWPRHYWQPWCS